MAKPIEPTPILEGEEALKFLKEMGRIDSLKPEDSEYKRREKFFKECEEILRKNPQLRIPITAELNL